MTNEIKHDIIRFIFGGNCTFTIVDDSISDHFSYKIKKKKTDDNSKIYHACMLTANKSIYFGYFKVVGNRLIFKHSRKYDVPENDPRVMELLKVIRTRHNLNESIHIFHNGRCAYCGRMLTDPKSIERGFGPECWKMIRKHK